MVFRIQTNSCGFLLVLMSVMVLGCRPWVIDRDRIPEWIGPAPETLPNPLTVPLVPRELIMDEVSDELDNYFRIAREERIRVVEDIMTEGWIDTHPKIGSTYLEPWRQDSTWGFERAHATLQTIRRFAKVRVVPTRNNFQIDVKVFKEIEDLEQPQHATISGDVFRHDNTLDFEELDPDRFRQKSQVRKRGWIPLGRDFSLEQLILRNLSARIESSITGAAETR